MKMTLPKKNESNITGSDRSYIQSVIGGLQKYVTNSQLRDIMRDIHQDFSRANPSATSNDGMDMALIGIQLMHEKLNIVNSEFYNFLKKIGCVEIKKRNPYDEDEIKKSVEKKSCLFLHWGKYRYFHFSDYRQAWNMSQWEEKDPIVIEIYLRFQNEKNLPTTTEGLKIF